MKWRATTFLFLCSSALAVQLDEIPFEEKVKQASVVLIGVVEEAQPHSRDFRREFARIRVEKILKGTAPHDIRIETYGSLAEEAVFVTAGRRYLFLLRLYEGTYYSVNGRFGAIPVDGKPDD